jgi:hypothetical protein
MKDSETFKFVRVVDKSKPNSYGQWYLEANDVEDVVLHWWKYVRPKLKEGFDYANNELCYKMEYGHYQHHFDATFGSLLLRMYGLYGLKGFDLIETYNKLVNNVLTSRIDAVDKYTIYLSEDTQVMLLDDRFFEIVQVVEKQELEFPTDKNYTEADIRYIQWNDGIHWYAKVGNYDVVDEQSNQKWDTKEEAQKAAINFLKSLKNDSRLLSI